MARRLAATLAILLALAGTATAGTLLDRVVTLSTLTYDDPAEPLYVGRGETVLVTDDLEFGLDREGVQNGLDVVPVMVNVAQSRIEFDFSMTAPGFFAEAVFNGYVLTFETDCVLFEGARIDKAVTTFPLDDEALGVSGGSLTINVAGLSFGRASRLAVDLDVADCPLS